MRSLLIGLASLFTLIGQMNAQTAATVDWPSVGNDPGCMRYSALDQINRENV
jgi:quinoprotein glucose dehydrogenase